MNRGKALLIIILVFCAFLIYSINKINHRVHTDFIAQIDIENYQRCKEQLISIENAQKDHSFKVVQADPFVVIELPKNDSDEHIVGEILFYCSYDADLDKHIQLVLDKNRQQLIPRSWLQAKGYLVKVGWIDHNEWHYDEKYIILK